VPDDPVRGWIQSRPYDLTFFILSPLAGLLIIWAGRGLPFGSQLIVAATFLVAIPHYLSSFSFFLGDDNLPYYRARRLAYFAGPVLIFAIVAGLRVIGFHRPVQSTMFVWNIYHVSRQSSGILALYRRLNLGAVLEKRSAGLAILGTNAAMAFWHPDRFPPLFTLLETVHPALPWMVRVVAVPVAGVALLRYGWLLYRRTRPVSGAEIGFLVSSLLLFHPYLWVPDADQATFAMLMGHFIQYLAIVWLLNRRKYAGADGSEHQRILAAISANWRRVVAAMCTVGLVFFLTEKALVALGIGMAYVIIWNAMTLIHFYLDGLVWAFRIPHVRETIGPYLTPPSRIAA